MKIAGLIAYNNRSITIDNEKLFLTEFVKMDEDIRGYETKSVGEIFQMYVEDLPEYSMCTIISAAEIKDKDSNHIDSLYYKFKDSGKKLYLRIPDGVPLNRFSINDYMMDVYYNN